jgi:hypothetical protein
MGSSDRSPGAADPKYHKYTVAEAIDHYIATIVPQKAVSTHRAHMRHLTHWKERIGQKRLDDIPSSYFSEWRDSLITEYDH